MSQYVISHPVYGEATEIAEPGIFTGSNNVAYVPAYWGPARIFAAVPMREVVVDEIIAIVTIVTLPGGGGHG